MSLLDKRIRGVYGIADRVLPENRDTARNRDGKQEMTAHRSNLGWRGCSRNRGRIHLSEAHAEVIARNSPGAEWISSIIFNEAEIQAIERRSAAITALRNLMVT
jgi:hypothetical protein